MFGKETCEMILRDVLAMTSAADEAQVTIFTNESGLTRFAENYIHQNVVERNGTVNIRVIKGRKNGFAWTNRVDSEGLKAAVDRAFEIARLSEENPDFPGLPTGGDIPTRSCVRPSTERFSPQKRAEGVAQLIKKAKNRGFRSSGAFETGVKEVAIGNSRGIRAYHPTTIADFSTVVMSDDSSGFAHASAIDVHDLDVEKLADEAIRKTEMSLHPIDLPPGEYPVILEEYAVSTMVSFLSMLGFNGMAVRERRSFLSEKQNQRIAVPGFSLWDDGSDPRGLPQPFDFEGFPKKRVDLVSEGIARDAVWDSTNARLAGKENTGHALPAPNTWGPVPLHLFMAPGTVPKDELIKGIKKGIWVSRFHYTNPVHPKKTVITGMTRDGTFLIEEGKISRGIKNLRFTFPILEALEKMEGISKETRTFVSSFGSTCVPSVRISSLSFSGATTF